MRTTYWNLCFLLLSLLTACTEGQELTPDAEKGVEVVFSAKQPAISRAGEEPVLPSILIFKQVNQPSSDAKQFLQENEKTTEWEKSVEEGGTYQSSLLLSSGKYRFLLAGGFTESVEESRKGEGKVLLLPLKKEGEKRNYEECYFTYPVTQQAGQQILGTCNTDFVLDSNESGFDVHDKEYSLVAGNHFDVRRKITRLQSRFDLLVRRGERNGKQVVPIQEGTNNESALNNALKQIEKIDLVVDGVSSRCWLNGLKFAEPGRYTFSLAENDDVFSEFSATTFMKDLKASAEDDYTKYNRSAYYRGPLLFPAPDGQTVTLTLAIDYKGTVLPTKIITKTLELKRNTVSLLVLWLLVEEIGVEIEIGSDHLEYNNAAKGDDGFWN